MLRILLTPQMRMLQILRILRNLTKLEIILEGFLYYKLSEHIAMKKIIECSPQLAQDKQKSNKGKKKKIKYAIWREKERKKSVVFVIFVNSFLNFKLQAVICGHFFKMFQREKCKKSMNMDFFSLFSLFGEKCFSFKKTYEEHFFAFFDWWKQKSA